MCLFTKRRNFGAHGDQSIKSSRSTLPPTSDASLKPQTSAASVKSESARTCVSGEKRAPSTPKIAAVHNKMKTKPNENEKKSSVALDAKKKQLEEAQKAMGIAPNTALLERLEKEKKERAEPPKENSCRSKIGDIAFSFMGKKAAAGAKPVVGSKEDTVYPGKATNDPEELVEDEKKDADEEPNSENYMYNVREIRYTVHDMIRTLDKNDVPEATGDVVVPDGMEKPSWDPYAEIEAMEKREGFDCYALRRNTFVSGTTCFRNDDDFKSARTQKTVRERQGLVFTEKIRNLNETKMDNCGDESLRSMDKTPRSTSEQSLLKTQKTMERSGTDETGETKRSQKTKRSAKNSKSTKSHSTK